PGGTARSLQRRPPPQNYGLKGQSKQKSGYLNFVGYGGIGFRRGAIAFRPGSCYRDYRNEPVSYFYKAGARARVYGGGGKASQCTAPGPARPRPRRRPAPSQSH